jgi:hypothetical protein
MASFVQMWKGSRGAVFWVSGEFLGEFLDKVGLTGLANRSDRYPLSV